MGTFWPGKSVDPLAPPFRRQKQGRGFGGQVDAARFRVGRGGHRRGGCGDWRSGPRRTRRRPSRRPFRRAARGRGRPWTGRRGGDPARSYNRKVPYDGKIPYYRTITYFIVLFQPFPTPDTVHGNRHDVGSRPDVSEPENPQYLQRLGFWKNKTVLDAEICPWSKVDGHSLLSNRVEFNPNPN